MILSATAKASKRSEGYQEKGDIKFPADLLKNLLPFPSQRFVHGGKRLIDLLVKIQNLLRIADRPGVEQGSRITHGVEGAEGKIFFRNAHLT